MKKAISILLFIIIISSFFSLTILGEGEKSYREYDLGQYLIPQDIFHKPLAQFKIKTQDGREVTSILNDDKESNGGIGPPIEITVGLGETITIEDLSIARNPGEKIDKFDFQVYCKNNDKKNVIKIYDKLPEQWEMTEEGVWNFYLCVRGDTPSSKLRGWQNWSDNGTRRIWGRNSFGVEMWWYFSHIRVNVIPKEQDYSTLIIRTGTEGQPDSKPRANVQNEAVVEYRVTNSNESTGMAEVEFEIKNAKNITVEGLLESKINGEKITGKLDMSELYAFGELQRHPEYIIYPEISLDRQRWQNKKDIKIREYTAGQKSYKDAKGNYGNMTQNEYGEEHIARAIRVKWTVKDANRPVTMVSCMKPFDKEKNIENNKDIVIIQNDKYEFSCFNNYTITHNTIYKPGEPKNKCTFWMMQPIHADDELEDEFLVLIRVERYQNGQEYTTMYEPDEPIYFKLNKDNPVAAIDFIADNPRYILTIYRKGKELDEYKDNERFKNQYFMGYEKAYNGEKYYYYKFYHSYDHGFFYPTKLGLSYMREEKAREFIGRFGYTNFDKWNEAIR